MHESHGAPPSSAPANYFERLYAGGNDPWKVETSWYERRKYALTVASLPRERYGDCLELGCAFGTMTTLLAERCDSILAVDAAENAIALARKRFASRDGMRFEHAVLPAGLPDVSVDLIVASELLNYFSRPDLDDLLVRLMGALKPGGDLLAAHFFTRNPLQYDGIDVHAHLRTLADLQHLVAHEDESFVLDVFRRA